MAEFCLDCWNKINESKGSRWRYVLSSELELCEECGEWRQVILAERLWGQIIRPLEELAQNIKNRK